MVIRYHITQRGEALDAVLAVAEDDIAADDIECIRVGQVADSAAGVFGQHIAGDDSVAHTAAEEKSVATVAVAEVVAPYAACDPGAGMVAVADAVFDRAMGNGGSAILGTDSVAGPVANGNIMDLQMGGPVAVNGGAREPRHGLWRDRVGAAVNQQIRHGDVGNMMNQDHREKVATLSTAGGTVAAGGTTSHEGALNAVALNGGHCHMACMPASLGGITEVDFIAIVQPSGGCQLGRHLSLRGSCRDVKHQRRWPPQHSGTALAA